MAEDHVGHNVDGRVHVAWLLRNHDLDGDVVTRVFEVYQGEISGASSFIWKSTIPGTLDAFRTLDNKRLLL